MKQHATTTAAAQKTMITMTTRWGVRANDVKMQLKNAKNVVPDYDTAIDRWCRQQLVGGWDLFRKGIVFSASIWLRKPCGQGRVLTFAFHIGITTIHAQEEGKTQIRTLTGWQLPTLLQIMSHQCHILVLPF